MHEVGVGGLVERGLQIQSRPVVADVAYVVRLVPILVDAGHIRVGGRQCVVDPLELLERAGRNEQLVRRTRSGRGCREQLDIRLGPVVRVGAVHPVRRHRAYLAGARLDQREQTRELVGRGEFGHDCLVAGHLHPRVERGPDPQRPLVDLLGGQAQPERRGGGEVFVHPVAEESSDHRAGAAARDRGARHEDRCCSLSSLGLRLGDVALLGHPVQHQIAP